MLQPDVQLVSINDHLMEPPDIWAGMGGDYPHVATVDGAERWVIGDHSIPLAQTGVLAAGADPGGPRATRYDEMHPAAVDPGERLRSMDLDGVQVHTIWPNVIGFAGERLRYLDSAPRWDQAARRYNDFVVDWCAADPDRLVAAAVLPLHSGQAARREAERAAGLGAKAVLLPHDLRALEFATLYSGEWDPLFSFMDDAGLPLLVHIGPGVGLPEGVSFDSIGSLLTVASFHVAAAMVETVFAKVPVRHPGLDVVFVEGATGWLPFVEERMAFFERRQGVWDPGPEELSTHDVAQRCSASFIGDPYGIAHRHDIGIERMVWQCDFPHNDSYWPHSRDQVAAAMADVPDDEVRLLVEENARRLLRLPRPRPGEAQHRTGR